MDKVFKGGWNDRSALVYWVLLVHGLLKTGAWSVDVTKGCCVGIKGGCYHVYGSKSLCSWLQLLRDGVVS